MLCETSQVMPVRRERLPHQKISLKFLADHLQLSPATISLVMNRSTVADSIPQETKDRIFAAAREFNYRPSFVARSLRTHRSFTVGVMVPEVSEGYGTLLLSGIEDYLLQEGYFYFVVSHRHKPDLIDEYPRLLLERCIDGLIAVDTPSPLAELSMPVVKVSGNDVNRGKAVTHIVLDHCRAAHLALDHLASLGHRRIAVIKGQDFSSDTEIRWNAIQEAAREHGLKIPPQNIAQLVGDSASPELGYEVAKKIFAKGAAFTALFAFNDVCAIGAIQAIKEKGLRVPEDISVIGFDDIQSAAFQSPGLTTIRQPLRKMGLVAAETLLRRIAGTGKDIPRVIRIEPQLVVRGTTGACNSPKPSKKKTRH
jgi:DNA-binding LacI/PurR family transcriptional regulator